jgi:hypothetical protein
LLFFFYCLNQFSDPQLQPGETRSLHHHTTENTHAAKPYITTDKNGSIHNLVSDLVGPEEFDDTNNNRNQEDGTRHIEIDHNPLHSIAVKVS